MMGVTAAEATRAPGVMTLPARALASVVFPVTKRETLKTTTSADASDAAM